MKRSLLRGYPDIVMFYAELLYYLVLARVIVSCCPFRRISAFVSRAPARTEPSPRTRRLARMAVNKGIYHLFNRLPFRTTCFHRAVAAHLMLRRRGIHTSLHYGAAVFPDKGLTGHVWLMDGTRFVVGRDAARHVHPLARF